MAFLSGGDQRLQKQLGKIKKSTTVDQIASMRIFIAVAEAGALNGAARQMEISPSAVSKHIAALENKLGAQLLNPYHPSGCFDRGWRILSAKLPNDHR